VLRFTILLLALAFLLPLAATADSCTDCLYGGVPGCCPPSCCSCCAQGAPAPAAVAWVALRPVTAEAAPSPREAVYPSSHPRDIFHVPKS
jgi:hypothetical protein